MYKITNFGNTRSIYIDGLTWEISKNTSIETDNAEVAEAFDKLMFVDVEQSEDKPTKTKAPVKKKKAKKPTKRKATVRKRKKKKATIKNAHKKIKHAKI